MKGYFISTTFSSQTTILGGVEKKVKAQINYFNSANINIKHLCLFNKSNLINKIKRKYFFNYYKNQIPNDFYDCDFYYIRKTLLTNSFFNLIKNIKKRTNAIILLEIPTFPYDKEIPINFLNYITLLQDKYLRSKLKYFINYVITLSNDLKIFNIPTIKIINGINCSSIPIRSVINHDSLNISAVAKFSTWHGYDRLIKGLYQYYKNNPEKKVFIYFAGDGDAIENYKKLVIEYNLSEYVIFKGFLSGLQLDELFNITDIAACTFGWHRTGVLLDSSLKSREYMARGIPMITSTKIDVLPENFPYCFYVPEDESPVNIQNIIDYYNNIISLKNITDITNELRQFAEDNCDMSKTMQPIISYLKESTAK